ncbi:MAG TPA: hypothetical protein VIP98_19580 [Microlunatus sp.]
MTVGQVVPVAILVAGLVVSLWLLIKSARGRARGFGIIGVALLFLGVLCRFAYEWIVERYLGRVEDELIVSILAAEIAVGGVLIGAGLLFVTRAIVVAGWPSKK